jgi:hypothetical protein
MSPKREVKGLNSEPTKASISTSSSRKRVTITNTEPNVVPTLSYPKKLLRKSKNTLGHSYSSKGKSSYEETISTPKKSITISEEKLFPIIEKKLIIEPSKIVEEKDKTKMFLYKNK